MLVLKNKELRVDALRLKRELSECKGKIKEESKENTEVPKIFVAVIILQACLKMV